MFDFGKKKTLRKLSEEIEKAERENFERRRHEEETKKSQLKYNSVVDQLKQLQINRKTENDNLQSQRGKSQESRDLINFGNEPSTSSVRPKLRFDQRPIGGLSQSATALTPLLDEIQRKINFSSSGSTTPSQPGGACGGEPLSPIASDVRNNLHRPLSPAVLRHDREPQNPPAHEVKSDDPYYRYAPRPTPQNTSAPPANSKLSPPTFPYMAPYNSDQRDPLPGTLPANPLVNPALTDLPLPTDPDLTRQRNPQRPLAQNTQPTNIDLKNTPQIPMLPNTSPASSQLPLPTLPNAAPYNSDQRDPLQATIPANPLVNTNLRNLTGPRIYDYNSRYPQHTTLPNFPPTNLDSRDAPQPNLQNIRNVRDAESLAMQHTEPAPEKPMVQDLFRRTQSVRGDFYRPRHESTGNPLGNSDDYGFDFDPDSDLPAEIIKKIKNLKSFSGLPNERRKLSPFLQELETSAKVCSPKIMRFDPRRVDKIMAQVLSYFLCENALMFYAGLSEREKDSYVLSKKALMMRFGDRLAPTMIQANLNSIKQTDKMSVVALKEQISYWVDILINETMQNERVELREYRRETLCYDKFMIALNDRIYNHMALKGFPQTFDKLFEEALAAETAFLVMRPSTSRNTYNIMHASSNHPEPPISQRGLNNRNRNRNFRRYNDRNPNPTQSYPTLNETYIDTSRPPPTTPRGSIFDNTYYPENNL